MINTGDISINYSIMIRYHLGIGLMTTPGPYTLIILGSGGPLHWFCLVTFCFNFAPQFSSQTRYETIRIHGYFTTQYRLQYCIIHHFSQSFPSSLNFSGLGSHCRYLLHYTYIRMVGVLLPSLYLIRLWTINE